MSPTVKMRDYIEASGFQFLKDCDGWALYDLDSRLEVADSRADTYGGSIWVSATTFGIKEEDV